MQQRPVKSHRLQQSERTSGPTPTGAKIALCFSTSVGLQISVQLFQVAACRFPINRIAVRFHCADADVELRRHILCALARRTGLQHFQFAW
jgi:hypothetical protein